MKETEDKNTVENGGKNFRRANKKKRSPKKAVIAICILMLLVGIAYFVIYYLNINISYILTGELEVKGIYIAKYNTEDTTVTFNVETVNTLLPNNIQCYLSEDEYISTDDICSRLINEKFEFSALPKDYYIILANMDNRVLGTCKITDYICENVNLDIAKEFIYLVSGEAKEIEVNLVSIGEASKSITLKSDDESIVAIKDKTLVGKGDGSTLITAMDEYGNFDTIQVVVTSLIGKELNNKKPSLKGEVYTKDEADLLDKLLEYRVNEAGYGTRAGVVAAARFLALEFKYGIPYFFENGRLNDSGTAFVDGEGRYYHKGLYLHKSKFKDIVATFAGPAIWGMPLMNYENAGHRYIRNTKMPNGLDCSGFVSWALLNGGFDPGDYGAGETEEPNQMSDLGEFVYITPSLLNSGRVRTGDLVNVWGHIGIIIGMENDDIYVAETLYTFEKLVVQKYTKDNITDAFSYIVLMDSYYKEDGNYTPMW